MNEHEARERLMRLMPSVVDEIPVALDRLLVESEALLTLLGGLYVADPVDGPHLEAGDWVIPAEPAP